MAYMSCHVNTCGKNATMRREPAHVTSHMEHPHCARLLLPPASMPFMPAFGVPSHGVSPAPAYDPTHPYRLPFELIYFHIRVILNSARADIYRHMRTQASLTLLLDNVDNVQPFSQCRPLLSQSAR